VNVVGVGGDREWLAGEGGIGIAGIDGSAGAVIPDPGIALGVPSPALAL